MEEGQINLAENFDQATVEQVRDIESEVAASCPLVTETDTINVLSHEYSIHDKVYQAKLKDLFSRYEFIRKTRGDGNCFYRSFGFKILEECLSDKTLADKLIEAAQKAKTHLVQIGYPEYTVEDFLETFLELANLTKKENCIISDLLELFNNQSYSDYCVVFLRLIVSSYLQENEAFYSAFVEGYPSMRDFCSQEVEPMSKESDHIHIIALSNALGITIQVEYMDRSGDEEKVNHHLFPDDGSHPSMFLLYRPGHYDILYPKVEINNVGEG